MQQGSRYTQRLSIRFAAPPASIVHVTYWSNDGTSAAGSQPAAAVPLAATNGLYSVLLGDATLPNMPKLRCRVCSHR